MQDRALHHALKPAGRRGIDIAADFQAFQFIVQILDYRVAKLAKVDAARLHYLCRFFIVDQRQKQMFKRRIFMRTFGRVLERIVQRSFEGFGKTRHSKNSNAV